MELHGTTWERGCL